MIIPPENSPFPDVKEGINEEKSGEGLSLMVVIPTFNEAANLPRLMRAIFDLKIPGLKVLLVDDNSPDGTGKLGDELAEKFYKGCLFVMHRTGKLGFGSACIAGFKEAAFRGADFIAGMDADLSHDPASLKQFLEAIKEADVIIGSRYTAGGSLDPKWGKIRRFISAGGSSYARKILGLKIKDTTTGYRMYRRRVIEGLPLDKVLSNGYCFEIEMAYLCQKYGYRVKEVPIFFADRTAGESKMTFRILVEALWKIWEIKFRHYKGI